MLRTPVDKPSNPLARFRTSLQLLENCMLSPVPVPPVRSFPLCAAKSRTAGIDEPWLQIEFRVTDPGCARLAGTGSWFASVMGFWVD